MFAESKLVQSYLIALMMIDYGISVDVINGETAAVATSKNTRSRKNIIDAFQAQQGFGVLIMSPVALTVTGANNVIHLERHWNPAKEAQATDRVYRIGQQKQVNVYLPMAVHPEIRSFDLQLHQLLNNKVDLSEAVVANPDIEPEQMMSMFN
nr:C-terminal helicase domain-containing protein [uncultured Haemophilus sp.]